MKRNGTTAKRENQLHKLNIFLVEVELEICQLTDKGVSRSTQPLKASGERPVR
jgi:hypothetical protein